MNVCRTIFTGAKNEGQIVILLFFLLLITGWRLSLHAADIERFEHLDTRNGLSQNNVLSMFCDHQGYMWFGTMDGLNRFDGHRFKIFKAEEGKTNSLSHNRISEIWEDSLNFLWVKTYEGYYHYFKRPSEEFITFPNYIHSVEEKNSVINCFHQPGKYEIWLGSSNSGVYYLKAEPGKDSYSVRHFLSRGISSISNNSVNFIISDKNKNVWIGTRQGLNLLKSGEINKDSPYFNHLYANIHFSSACIINDLIFFGTKNNGLFLYNMETGRFEESINSLSALKGIEINMIKKSLDNEFVITGTKGKGLFFYFPGKDKLVNFIKAGTEVRNIYVDRQGLVWVKTQFFGISKIDPKDLKLSQFTLTPIDIQPLIDDERPYFYEDSRNNLWIGIHGGGLAIYERDKNSFLFYRNKPNSLQTISSDFVHCLAEDKSGLLWVGAGQINGGINKVIMPNPTFQKIIPEESVENLADNMVRCLFEDRNGYIWMATKSGTIYIYREDYTLHYRMESIQLENRKLPGYNIYSIIVDNKGYIWMGSKGGGILVSTQPLPDNTAQYQNIKFYWYKHEPGNLASLSNDFVYSVFQDSENKIWIGTYGGGINLVISRQKNSLTCKRITTQNSTLSCNDVRFVFEDTRHRLWIATTFGLNLLENISDTEDTVRFRTFLYSPDIKNSISYNDIIHIYEDSKNQLWFGTFGGGVNLLIENIPHKLSFKHFRIKDGLVNDAVFAITGDLYGNIWFSTENGLSKFDKKTGRFKNFDRNSGLFAENFNENTCLVSKNGKILFGGKEGTVIINPGHLYISNYKPPVVLTNFQLFNRDVNFNVPGSPLLKSIETTDSIVLKYYQSSFSFEYAGLSFYAPDQNRYRFILENFENEWNDIGNQQKATYTNLSPGEYWFRVKAASWDGTWNENPRSVYVNILPPWWKSTQAYVIYILLLFILLVISRRLFLNYYHLQNDLKVERKVNDIKLQFFTNISHEIRTPLTLILGPIEDIKAVRNLPQIVYERINVMERNGKRMLRLINQLLEFRKIQKKKATLKVREIDIVAFVKEIFTHFIPIAEQKKINFQFNSEVTDLPVFVDPNKFDSVIFNILSNAFKYTPSGKKISMNISKSETKYVDVTISDEGRGIPEDRLKVIFERFTPLSQTTSSFEGTGIGLNLSNEIILLHKGKIIVRSELGKGSTFIVRLILGKKHFNEGDFDGDVTVNKEYRHPEPVEPVEGKEPVEENGKDIKLHKILLVEDNHEIVIYLKDALKKKFEIITAQNGKEGLSAISFCHPDVIITDIMMPVMDGIEMTKHVKNNIETSHIPVIMLTAKSSVEDQIVGVESGAEAYILKPFNTEYLSAVILNLLKQRELIIRKYRDNNLSLNHEIKITSKDEEFLNEIVRIIDENYSNPEFNVEQLTQLSSVSRTILYNKLKGLTGLSPVDFLRQMRLKYAAGILKKTGYNVSETAYITGFNDVKYFSKCFKEMYGSSPKDYRKNEI